MKNDDQMFQSVLSRRNEYRERRKKRILTIKHTVPVLACFCLCAVLGLGYWNHFRNIPSIPVQPDVIDETTLDVPETTTSESEYTSTTQITNQTEPVFTTTPTSELETDFITATTSIQTQTTAAVTDASESPVTQQVTGKQTETQASATTHLVTEPPPVTTVSSSNHVTTAIRTDITLTTMEIGELTVSISDTVTTFQTYLPTTGTFTTDQMTIMTDDTTATQNNHKLSYTLEKSNCMLPVPPSQGSIDPVTGQKIPFVAQIEYDGERWNVVLAEQCEDACIVSGVMIDHVLYLSVACLSAPGEYSEETIGFSLRFFDEVNASICNISVDRQDFESASEFYEVYTDTPLIVNDS